MNFLRFSSLALILSFPQPVSSQNLLTQMSQYLIEGKPDILYFSDTDHRNLRLASIYTELVSQIKRTDPEYNCVFLESDKQMFQPAVDAFMNEEKSWEDSVGAAQTAWEEITGRPYKQAPKAFLERVRESGLKVFAVDWSEKSVLSERMKSLFKRGFSGDWNSLKKAFDLGVNVRNSVMAQNIYQILNANDGQGKPLCGKALMFTSGMHLAEDLVTPGIGRQKYRSIASHSLLENYSQAAHEILDCNTLKSYSSIENREQCRQGETSDSVFVIENLFSQGDFFETAFMKSVSQTAGDSFSTFPKINYNIMVLPEN